MGAVKVTYNAGYASTPKDLKLALFDLVNYYMKDEHKERRTLGGAHVTKSRYFWNTNFHRFSRPYKKST